MKFKPRENNDPLLFENTDEFYEAIRENAKYYCGLLIDEDREKMKEALALIRQFVLESQDEGIVAFP